MTSTSPSVLFLGGLYAGHRTRFMNLQAHTANDPRIRSEYRGISGWVEGGLIERLGFVPKGVRGRLRAVAEAAPFAQFPRPDLIWTSAGELLAPYTWSQLGPFRRPVVLDVDATPAQLEEHAQLYFGRAPRAGARRAFGALRLAVVTSRVTRFAAWSRWAADGLKRMGIAPERIRIVMPGVDLDMWRPTLRAPGRRIKLLFVGADFERKGGPILLEAVRSRSERFELDVVTKTEVKPAPWYRVHRAEPNSTTLHRLYSEADLFILPTQAECFGIAAIEAMASGLPVVMGDSGAAREIVDDGETGFIIQSRPEALARVLDTLSRDDGSIEQMGRRARSVAEERFDGQRNDGRIVDLLLEEHERFRARLRRGGDSRSTIGPAHDLARLGSPPDAPSASAHRAR